MCGIAGLLVSANAPARPDAMELTRMAGALQHRGPDGYGLYVDDHAGLAHARLSIIDRAGGAQPMTSEDGSLWVSFNGEIFNYIELRAELEALGHRFSTRSDTEVILHAFEQWNVKAFARFNGQFAIALWDSKQRELWLARDQAGICPLFIAATADFVAFGSEAKALFAGGRVSPIADPMGVSQAFMLWSAAVPTTCFQGIESLEPGTACRFTSLLARTTHHFASVAFNPQEHPATTLEDASRELEHALQQAIKLRLRADVPVGAYLSGGLDSSVIAKLITLAESSPLETFSLRFEDQQFDEGSAQQLMATFLGTRHHEVVVGPKDIRDALPWVVRQCETPLTRTGPAPMFLLSRLVRGLNFRVVLTGEGADEFLGGYDIFKEARIRAFWARQPGSTARPALLARVHPYVAGSKSPDMWQEFFRRGLDNPADPFFSHRPRWENTAWALRFLAPAVRESNTPQRLIDAAAARLPDGWARESVVSRAQTLETSLFMATYLLGSQGDRALMANSVEGRFPFLDPNVIALGRRLPDRLKLAGLREKISLRALASRHLPESVWKRRKWPYRAPIASALFGPGAPDYVRELLSPAALAECPLLDPKPASAMAQRGFSVSTLGEREEMALMGLLTLQIWLHEFKGWSYKNSTLVPNDLTSRPPDVLMDRRASSDTTNGFGPTNSAKTTVPTGRY